MENSQICQFYNNQKVFITGATGFMGTVLAEKLLRSTNVAKIYLLIRSKKGKDANTRMDIMLDNVLFTKLRKENPNFKNRIIAVAGDCTLSDLGLSVGDREQLIVDVNIVFHAAASVYFHENIKQAYINNVQGTANLLTFCKQMRHLKSFVHLSTAFSNSPLDKVDEVFYDYSINYQQIEEMILKETSPKEVDRLTERYNIDFHVKTMTPQIRFPVTSTYKEPIEYWTNSLGGPASVIASASLGLIRVFPCENSQIFAELVPVDMAVAALIATAWDINNRYEISRNEIPIYNYISSNDNSVTWYEFAELNKLQFLNYPLKNAMWVPKFRIMSNSMEYKLLFLIFHYFPAVVADFFRMINFKKPYLVPIYRKINNSNNAFWFFTSKNWKFSNDNIKEMWNELSEVDKELFPFDISAVNWLKYLRNYHKGLRLYVHKDPLDSLHKAKIRATRFEILHKVMVYAIYFIGIKNIL
ncbi:NAD binding 4 and/or Sterile domain containing protein, partial [Asbolus verrucosus]